MACVLCAETAHALPIPTNHRLRKQDRIVEHVHLLPPPRLPRRTDTHALCATTCSCVARRPWPTAGEDLGTGVGSETSPPIWNAIRAGEAGESTYGAMYWYPAASSCLVYRMIISHGPGCTPGARSVGPRAGGCGEHGRSEALLFDPVFCSWSARGSGDADVPLLREDVVEGERGEGGGNGEQRASHARVKALALLPVGPVRVGVDDDVLLLRAAPAAGVVRDRRRDANAYKNAGGGRRRVGARTQPSSESRLNAGSTSASSIVIGFTFVGQASRMQAQTGGRKQRSSFGPLLTFVLGLRSSVVPPVRAPTARLPSTSVRVAARISTLVNLGLVPTLVVAK
ncbi:hypothetical protein B0H14DRAFT_3634235 [Mycena olivaceomarginata]|nr:hypothetical protein B0H14DRAFT_3634235 [Mycena olivaceomarginata]